MAEKKNIHDGHRDRLRAMIRENGYESLHDHNLLEFLLFNAIPYKDTNETAHKLMAKFGSIRGVINASPQQLENVDGMTPNATLFIKALPTLMRRYMVEGEDSKRPVTPMSILPQLVLNLSFRQNECLFGVFVGAKGKLMRIKKLVDGEFSLLAVAKDIIKVAIENDAEGIILAHNHPSGNYEPSEADNSATAKLNGVLKMVNLQLLDHFIVGENKAYSMFLRQEYEFSEKDYRETAGKNLYR